MNGNDSSNDNVDPTSCTSLHIVLAKGNITPDLSKKMVDLQLHPPCGIVPRMVRFCLYQH